MSYIKVILVKSAFGRIPSHRRTILGLGLRKINSFVVLEDTNLVKGMIRKVNYLVKVDKCEGNNVFK